MEELVNTLSITNFAKESMKRVDRHNFVVNKSDAYRDGPSPLFLGQTISAPHIHGVALDALSPVLEPGSHILDIGSGSGYLTACFGYLVDVNNPDEDNRGKVIGIDIYPELVSYSEEIINTHEPSLFRYKRNFKIVAKDGKLGHPSRKDKELYDGIHIGAACKKIPYFVLQQLKRGGILVMPLELSENNLQICIITKELNGDIHINSGSSVRYVPLV